MTTKIPPTFSARWLAGLALSFVAGCVAALLMEVSPLLATMGAIGVGAVVACVVSVALQQQRMHVDKQAEGEPAQDGETLSSSTDETPISTAAKDGEPSDVVAEPPVHASDKNVLKAPDLIAPFEQDDLSTTAPADDSPASTAVSVEHPSTSTLQFDRLAASLQSSRRPIERLRAFVKDIRIRQDPSHALDIAADAEEPEASEMPDDIATLARSIAEEFATLLGAATGDKVNLLFVDEDEDKDEVEDALEIIAEDERLLPPSELELFAARVLEEAGLFKLVEGFPDIDVIRPRTSRMLYLRPSNTQKVSYPAMQQLIRLEAALNALRFARASLPTDATLEDAYRLNQALTRSIVAQAAPIDEPPELGDGLQPDGEYAVRYGISQAIETLQLPYRLTARYRTNVTDGNVAIEFDMSSAEVFLASQLVEGLGVVHASGDMRQRAAADYALRMGLLLAAEAFRCSTHIHHVWVAAVIDTPKRHNCYYSVDFDRWRFARLDLEQLGDLAEVYHGFAANMRYEGGWLRPVRQGFHLDEERFCPPRRFQPVALSSRRLEGSCAERLGCDHVSGLAIEESDGRAAMANAIALRMAPAQDEKATQKNVRMIMDLAGNDPDPTVREAAERVVKGLIEGTLGPDPMAVGEEFLRGDLLTRANDRAKQALSHRNPQQAAALLQQVLAPLDEGGLYADSPTVSYRFFSSYVQRALFNRACVDAHDNRTVMLVPDAYFEAHALLTTAYLLLENAEQACDHAKRLVELAPFEPHAYLQLARCLEMLDRDDEAIQQLLTLLEHGFEPMGLGFGYYRMAFFQWKRGNTAAAQACYFFAMQLNPSIVPTIAMELAYLHLQNPDALKEEMSLQEAEQALTSNGIPIAPTQLITDRFFECAQASFDAEVFPVARNFAHVMGSFSTDDITVGLIRSLEDAPDRPVI